MATKLKSADDADERDEAGSYLSLLSELDAALIAERKAHRRLVSLARTIEESDRQRHAAAS